MHPSNYPEAVDLPFNFSSVKNGFELHTPDRATDEKEGIWVIIQGGSVVLEQRHDSLELLKGKRPDGWPRSSRPCASAPGRACRSSP